MAKKKEVGKIVLYVENKGKGKVVFVDSHLSTQDMEAKVEGYQAVGEYATKVEMPEDFEETFREVMKIRHPRQINVLTVAEWEKSQEPVEEETEEKGDDKPDETALYEAAMKGGDEEIIAYFDAYKGQTGAHDAEIQDRSAYLDAVKDKSKKAYNKYLADYPEGIYMQEIEKLLEGVK